MAELRRAAAARTVRTRHGAGSGGAHLERTQGGMTMVFWIACVAGIAVAYLLGSTPTGYLAGKLLKGIDLRKHGSGSTGATNVLRTLGGDRRSSSSSSMY